MPTKHSIPDTALQEKRIDWSAAADQVYLYNPTRPPSNESRECNGVHKKDEAEKEWESRRKNFFIEFP